MSRNFAKRWLIEQYQHPKYRVTVGIYIDTDDGTFYARCPDDGTDPPPPGSFLTARTKSELCSQIRARIEAEHSMDWAGMIEVKLLEPFGYMSNNWGPDHPHLAPPFVGFEVRRFEIATRPGDGVTVWREWGRDRHMGTHHPVNRSGRDGSKRIQIPYTEEAWAYLTELRERVKVDHHRLRMFLSQDEALVSAQLAAGAAGLLPAPADGGRS